MAPLAGLLPSLPGVIFDLLISGPPQALWSVLALAGLHVFQRVPPTEKRGRVQTSSLLVTAFPLLPEKSYTLHPSALKIERTKEGGPGGQHANKTDSCVVITHLPTGLKVKASARRSQHQNLALGLQILASRLATSVAQQQREELDCLRQQQREKHLASGRTRTYRQKDDLVLDHKSAWQGNFAQWRKGLWPLLANK